VSKTTPTLDFARSFATFRIDTEVQPPKTVSHPPPYSLNNARIQLECRLTVRDPEADYEEAFVLGASCKTERVGVPQNIWTEPNADFAPIYGKDRFLNIKTYARAGMDVPLHPPGSGTQSDRQVGRIRDAFAAFQLQITWRDGVVLTTPDEIIAATLENVPLNARTMFSAGRYEAILEYPIKTMNANDRDGIYQTDTGPLLLPDFDAPPESMLNEMQLAYGAFNCPEWIEFLVRTPTPVGLGIDVYHYSQPVRYDARNEILALQAET